MSTVKVNEVRHLSNSGTANIVLESNANTNLQTTSTLGLGVTGTLTVSGASTFNGNVQVGNASTDTMALTSTVSGFNNFSGFTGEIRMYAGDATGESASLIAKGWLFCNGNYIGKTALIVGAGNHHNADLSGNDYEPLFNLLKASSDWGNTSTWDWNTNYVKLPDFRSRSPVGLHTGANNAIGTGADTVALTALTLGDTSGSENHALTIAELAVHTHVMNTMSLAATGVVAQQDSHTHTLSSHTHTSAAHAHSATSAGATLTTYGNSGGLGSNTGYTAQTIAIGGAESGAVHGTVAATFPAHSHTLTVNSTTPTPTGGPNTPNTGAASTSGGSLTMVDPTHRHVSTAADTGSGTAHTILSPRIAVNYIIKV